MGCGLKTLEDISQGAIIIKQKTEMGFISGGGLYDAPNESNDDSELDELNKKIEHITKKVSKTIFPGSLAQ